MVPLMLFRVAGSHAPYCFSIIKICEWEAKVLGPEQEDKTVGIATFSFCCSFNHFLLHSGLSLPPFAFHSRQHLNAYAFTAYAQRSNLKNHLLEVEFVEYGQNLKVAPKR